MREAGRLRLRELESLRRQRDLSVAEWEEVALLLSEAGRPEDAARAMRRAERMRRRLHPPPAAPPGPRAELDELGPAEELPEQQPSVLNRPIPFRVIGIPAVVVLLVCWLSFHVVSGAGFFGVAIIPKVSWSFSETFVSLDAITGMPFIAARSKYPLAVKALQRDGILETDEQFDARIKREAEEEQRQYEDDFRRRMGW